MENVSDGGQPANGGQSSSPRMPRTIQPELLDMLSPQHPDALHSRRDLRVINRMMGNPAWFRQKVRPRIRPGERALEIGAGTGELALQLTDWGVPTDGLDRVSRPEKWPASLEWHSEDLRSFAHYSRYPVILGNLIFHHLNDGELSELGDKLRSSARVIVACEPWRRPASQVLLRIAGPIFGANQVTLHDGHVSIAGGFAGNELPDALGLFEPEWNIECTQNVLGAYHLIATRRE
jgi:hypothetical protein